MLLVAPSTSGAGRAAGQQHCSTGERKTIRHLQLAVTGLRSRDTTPRAEFSGLLAVLSFTPPIRSSDIGDARSGPHPDNRDAWRSGGTYRKLSAFASSPLSSGELQLLMLRLLMLGVLASLRTETNSMCWRGGCGCHCVSGTDCSVASSDWRLEEGLEAN